MGSSSGWASTHKPRRSPAQWVQEALGVLDRHSARMDGARALALLPGDTPLHLLLPFLRGALRNMTQAQHQASVVRSLRQYENLQVREGLVHSQARAVEITAETACALCQVEPPNPRLPLALTSHTLLRVQVAAVPANLSTHTLCGSAGESKQASALGASLLGWAAVGWFWACAQP